MLTEKELDILKRRARGESQAAITKALGITQAAVSQFERKAHRKILEMERQQTLWQEFGIEIREGIDGKRVTYRGGRR